MLNLHLFISLKDCFQIYLAGCAFGPKSNETSGGYFHMANVFFRQNKMDTENSLHAETGKTKAHLGIFLSSFFSVLFPVFSGY